MANGFGSFYVGQSGLTSAQNAINVTANNLANVNTTGYVREQVRFSDKNYIVRDPATINTNVQQNGLGVSISDVAHARDIFIDKSYRQEVGRQGFYDTMHQSVCYVEDILQEMNGQEFKGAISDMWVAFQEFAKDPGNSTNQNLVLQKAELFLSRSGAVYKDLQSYQSNINLQIKDTVNRINEIGKEIYKLNLTIQKIEAGGVETAMADRDARDLLLDELAQYVKIDVEEDRTGFAYVKMEGVNFIELNRCNEIGLRAQKGSGFYTPYWDHLSDDNKEHYIDLIDIHQTISTEMKTDIGSLKALLVARGDTYGTFDYLSPENYDSVEDCVVMETQSDISYLVNQMVTQINDVFCPNKTADELLPAGSMTAFDEKGAYMVARDANGKEYKIYSDTKLLDEKSCSVGADGKIPPEELFAREGYPRYTEVTSDDGNTYYLYNGETDENVSSWYKLGNVSINSNLIKEVTNLPSYKQDGAVDYEIGNNLVRLFEKEQLKITPSDNTPCNFEDFYDKMISRLGTAGNVYDSATKTLTATIESIDNQRQQIMGVSSDEELTHMIKFQSAYNAASRYITVISEMTELLVQLI
ncbi:MAG: flagellar basal body rod C-terminal domain-containing protein [Agathobacter sp.]|nr:flagellar basal body rod C-terminal domain-containing protein [Agathobacter sp.]